MSESKYKLDKTEIKLLLFSSIVLLVFLYFNNGWHVHPDSDIYTSYLELMGEHGDKSKLNSEVALLRPLLFYLSLPFYYVFKDPIIAIGLLNSIFYLCSVIIFYRYLSELLNDTNLILASTIYFMSCFPVLYWGLSILTEMGSWFFLILGLRRLQYFSFNLDNNSDYITLIIIGLGILYKTNLFVLPLFITFYALATFGIKKFPTKSFFLITFFISLPLIINQLYVFYFFGVNYYDDFLQGSLFFLDKDPSGSSYGGGDYSKEYEFKYTQTYRTLTFFIAFPLLLFSFFGFKIIREQNQELYLVSKWYVISALIIILGYSSSLSYIGAGSPRYAFLLFPIIIPYSLIGLDYIIKSFLDKFNLPISYADKSLWFVVGFYCLSSFFVSFFDIQIRLELGLWI